MPLINAFPTNLNLMIEGETSVDKLLEKVHGRIKNSKGEKVRKSLEGFIMPAHRFLLKQRMEEYKMNYLQAHELEQEMEKICKGHYSNKKALIAIARKQLTVTWNILRYKQSYDIRKQPAHSPEQLLAKKKYYEKELSKLNLITQSL